MPLTFLLPLATENTHTYTCVHHSNGLTDQQIDRLKHPHIGLSQFIKKQYIYMDLTNLGTYAGELIVSPSPHISGSLFCFQILPRISIEVPAFKQFCLSLNNISFYNEATSWQMYLNLQWNFAIAHPPIRLFWQ